MKGIEKSPLRFQTEKIVRKYQSFELADRLEKNGVLPIQSINNCDVTDGNARVGIGAAIYAMPSGKGVFYDWNLSAPKAFFFCGDRLAMLSDENKFYFYDENTRTYRLEYVFNSEMTFVEVQDDSGVYHPYFCGKAGVFSYNESGEMKKVLALACLPVACSFQGRIFTAFADSIVYSAPFSTGDFSENIDGGGKVVLPFDTGEVVDMAATSNALFVFCKRGIWKLTAAGSARDFRLEKVGFTGNNILSGSACSVAFSGGEKVFFFDECGPWKLDGLGTKKICRNMTFSLKKTGRVCEHAYLNGKIVYALRSPGNFVQNFVIDLETEKAYPSFTAEGLSTLKGQAVGVVDGLVYALIEGEILPPHRISELVAQACDFGVLGEKTLRRLRLVGEGQFTLSISNGSKTKTFTLQTKDGEASLDVRLKGKFFRLRFVLGDRAVLRGLDVGLCKLKGLR